MPLPADMKLTDWIDGSIKPEREGVYERDFLHGVFFCRFHDGIWRHRSVSVEGASRSNLPSPKQVLPWRGLAEPPK